jgi:hypothetical protein
MSPSSLTLRAAGAVLCSGVCTSATDARPYGTAFGAQGPR